MQTIAQLIKAVGTGFTAPLGGRAFLIQSCDAGNTLTVTLTDAKGTQYHASGVGAGFKASPRAGFTRVDITTSADANVAFIVTDGDVDLQNSQVNVVVSNTNAIPVTIAGGNVNVNATNVGINNTSANPVPVSLISSSDATAVPVSGTVSVTGSSVSVTGTTTVAGTVNIGNAAGSPVPVTLTGSSDATAIPTQAQPIATTPADQAPVAVTTGGVALLAANAARKAFRVRNAGNGQLALTTATGTTFANAALVLQPGDLWNETDAPGAAWYAISDTGTTANLQVLS
ncbi:hypothetical protein [Trinickia symbiotica]|uniref:Uncharacterized protein n=1 Tax=Trinickia symbiotica TaxID=863227 RepID=A0A2N7X9N2_9BURK|nr:hypothetical protein [Trinickia symbiotica]PMS38459.1 hypothetical protein C0Z20_00810 [Trinickia symbiotica]